MNRKIASNSASGGDYLRFWHVYQKEKQNFNTSPFFWCDLHKQSNDGYRREMDQEQAMASSAILACWQQHTQKIDSKSLLRLSLPLLLFMVRQFLK